MSYHLDMEKKGKPKEIEMPPVPEETKVEEPTQQVDSEYAVHPEIAKEFTQPVESSPEESQQQKQVEEPKSALKESKNEKNIRLLREKAERAERAEHERDELIRKFQELESLKKQVQTPATEEEKYNELAPDDLVEAKYLKKYDKTIKELKEELNSYKQQTNLSAVEARLKSKYPDIDRVVSKDNVDMLRTLYPEVAETLNSHSDLYNKASAAYTLIKNLGIMPEDNYQEDREKAQKNAAKPRPLASISPQQGDSPLSKANAFANGLTDELKTQLRKEMELARRGL